MRTYTLAAPGERALAEQYLRKDAQQHPEHATARRAVVMAAMERSSARSAMTSAPVLMLLGYLREYESLRGPGREPWPRAMAFARDTFGEAHMAVYERYRWLP